MTKISKAEEEQKHISGNIIVENKQSIAQTFGIELH